MGIEKLLKKGPRLALDSGFNLEGKTNFKTAKQRMRGPGKKKRRALKFQRQYGHGGGACHGTESL